MIVYGELSVLVCKRGCLIMFVYVSSAAQSEYFGYHECSFGTAKR